MHATAFRSPRGVASLAVAMLLLFASSIVLFYLNRGLIFEQKTSANQLRSTIAFEAAEAGLEWATGMLNAPQDISDTCAFLATTDRSFRRKYVQTQFATASEVIAASNVFPGCKIDGTALSCSCPDVPVSGTAVASLGTTTAPGFTIAFANVAGDPEAVQVTSTGCSAQGGPCTPATSADADATATVSVILKLRPLLRAAPSAALSCGTSCTIGGSARIANTDPASNGITIDAGTLATVANTSTLETVPGVPTRNSVIENDAALERLSSADTSTCSGSLMFGAYFGSSLQEYAASPTTKTLGCSSDCGAQLAAAYDEGWRSFYLPSGLNLAGTSAFPASTVGGVTLPTLGGPNDGVTLVTPGAISIDGAVRLYGLLFANQGNAGIGSGAFDFRGAMVTCRDFAISGSGSIGYLQSALLSARRATGVMSRVPGSWRDFSTS